MSTDQAIEARFRRLESQVRRMRWISASALTLVGVVCLTSMQSKAANDFVAEMVTAKKLRIVDDDGRVRAELSLDGRREVGGVALSMFAPDMRENVRLRAGPSGAELRMMNGNNIALLEAAEHETSVQLRNGGSTVPFSETVACLAAKDSLGSLKLVHASVQEDESGRSVTRREIGVATLTPCDGLLFPR